MPAEGDSALSAEPHVRESVLRKCREAIEVKELFFAQYTEQIAALCQRMADHFAEGNRLWVMGNGGSACNAQHVDEEFVRPIIENRRPLPALDLVSQPPVLTAIANDKDFAKVFVDQLQLWGKLADLALALSTSGHSANLVYALQAARKIELHAIAFTGKDGERLAEMAEYAFTPSFRIHCIQECHVALLHLLWDLIHMTLGEEDIL